MGIPTIKQVRAREILDSKGRPMLEVDVLTHGGFMGRGSSPCGTSVGRHEAVVLRDGGERYDGLGVLAAARNAIEVVYPAIRGMDVRDQKAVDARMIELDGSPDKSRLGANTLLSVSVAVARAGAASLGIPLFRHLAADKVSYTIPRPCFNMINGGKYGARRIDIQEFLLIPTEVETLAEAVRLGAEVFYKLPAALAKRFGEEAVAIGHSAGYAAPANDPPALIETLFDAVELAGHRGRFRAGLDIAASHFFEPKNKVYFFAGSTLAREDLIQIVQALVRDYDLLLVEDPLEEDDFEGFAMISRRLLCLVAGDDLFVTDANRLRKGIESRAGNAIVIKPNMAGTLSEALATAALGRAHGYHLIPGGRAGGAVDDPVTDLAVAIDASLAKFGGPRAGEKTYKYNGLIRIEEELGQSAQLAALPPPATPA